MSPHRLRGPGGTSSEFSPRFGVVSQLSVCSTVLFAIGRHRTFVLTLFSSLHVPKPGRRRLSSTFLHTSVLFPLHVLKPKSCRQNSTDSHISAGPQLCLPLRSPSSRRQAPLHGMSLVGRPEEASEGRRACLLFPGPGHRLPQAGCRLRDPILFARAVRMDGKTPREP